MGHKVVISNKYNSYLIFQQILLYLRCSNFMKSILKHKLLSILIIITSIDFIAGSGKNGGCCCKCCRSRNIEENKGTKKSSKSLVDKKKLNIKSTKNDKDSKELGSKPIIINNEEHIKHTKKQKKEEEKKTNIINALAEYMNNRGNTNRAYITTQWSCEKGENGKYSIKYGRLTGIIDEDNTSITNKINSKTIGSIRVKINVTFNPEANQYFTINSNECTLEGLVKSLNLLYYKLRISKDEHLCADMKIKDKKSAIFINLSNSITYLLYNFENNTKMIGRLDISGNNKTPIYCSDGMWYKYESAGASHIDNSDPNTNGFYTPILKYEDIQKFNLTIRTS